MPHCKFSFSSSLLPVVFVALSGCAASDVTGVGDAPTATMGAVTYGNSQQAIDSSASASVSATFSNLQTSFVTNGSATTGAPPTGVNIATTGTASCSLIIVSAASAIGATFSFSNCLGDGAVLVNTTTGVGLSPTHQAALPSNTVTIQVVNAAPTVSVGGFNEQLNTTTAHGGNVFTVQFDHHVKMFSSDNSGGEFTLSTATALAPPNNTCGPISSTMAVTQDDSGSGSLVTATLPASPCVGGHTSTVSVHLNLNLVENLAGDSGVADPSLTQTYGIP